MAETGKMSQAATQMLDTIVHDALLAAQRERDLWRKAADAWETFASHQEWCATCADDGVSSCFDGNALRETANAANVAAAGIGDTRSVSAPSVEER